MSDPRTTVSTEPGAEAAPGRLRRFVWNPPLDEETVGGLVDIWVRATNAGGALGFLPPVRADEVAERAEILFERVRGGGDDLLVAFLGDEPVGWLVLERDARTYAAHWRTLKRLQVAPEHQNKGHGSALLEEARRGARDELNLEFLLLSTRSGSGADALYRRLGWRETGRIPRAMRIGPRDDRDEIVMVLDLVNRPGTPDGPGVQ